MASHEWNKGRLTVERVAGFLEVWPTDDLRAIVIKHPDLKPDANGAVKIALSPRQARHLSSLLMMRAEEAEEADTYSEPRIRAATSGHGAMYMTHENVR